MKIRVAVVVAALAAATLGAAVQAPLAQAVETTSQGALPTDKPVPWTPDVLGANGSLGKVNSMAQVGNLIVVGAPSTRSSTTCAASR